MKILNTFYNFNEDKTFEGQCVEVVYDDNSTENGILAKAHNDCTFTDEEIDVLILNWGKLSVNKCDEKYKKSLGIVDLKILDEVIPFEHDIIYIVTEENTYSIKEDIKKQGGKWNSTKEFWYFENDVDGFKTEKVIILK